MSACGVGHRPQEDAIQADRSAQGRVVRHGISTRPRGEPVTEIQEPIPDRRSRPMVGEGHDLDVVHLPEGDVDGQRVREGFFLLRIDHPIERVHVADQGVLSMGEISNRAVVRVGRGERSVSIAREIGQQQMIVEMQQPEMPPVARVEFLALVDGRRPDLPRFRREFS